MDRLTERLESITQQLKFSTNDFSKGSTKARKHKNDPINKNPEKSISPECSYELKLKITQEKYKEDIKNLQSYINILRKKITSLQSGPNTSEEFILQEKAKASTFYQALKAKEKDCLENHSGESLINANKRILELTQENKELEKKFFDAQNDMRRLYKEIKVQHQVIDETTKKFDEENKYWKDKYLHALEEIEEFCGQITEINKENVILGNQVKEKDEALIMLHEKFNPVRIDKGFQIGLSSGDHSKEANDKILKLFQEQVAEFSAKISNVSKQMNKVLTEIKQKVNQLEVKVSKLSKKLNTIKFSLKKQKQYSKKQQAPNKDLNKAFVKDFSLCHLVSNHSELEETR